ncbi:hypothetical protein [Actinacidiphila oryziradicis]|uniref:Uncharacterized protein n=1 Tax=Actinacidiphila oryziradicis TaxID=2571141 RepID=A0A4U0R7B1_9ACTN|nr:hypothetical protein [Actinacidiphila oryziradicis]TJZ90825.1 hypothetical protein FCI23_55680 [Actinacidiphila oryziradicis]
MSVVAVDHADRQGKPQVTALGSGLAGTVQTPSQDVQLGLLCRCLGYADAKTIVAGHRGARAECIGIVVELLEVSAASGQTDEQERFGEVVALTSPSDSNP